MNRHIEFIFGAVILFIMIAVFWQFIGPKEEASLPPDPGPPVEEGLGKQAELLSAIEEPVRVELGAPVESYEPEALMEVFPGLQSVDFDGVEYIGGTYEYSAGQVNFNHDRPAMVTPSPFLTDKGFETLLKNAADRFLESYPNGDVETMLKWLKDEEYGVLPQPPAIEINPSSKSTEDTILEAIATRYSDAYPIGPEPNSFQWRLPDRGVEIDVAGQELVFTDLSFQDLAFGEQSVLYQLENTLDDFFMSNGLEPDLGNDFDHPTNGGSLRGWRSAETAGLVCVREIVDHQSEFIGYSISCGVLHQATVDVPASPVACTMDAKQCPDGSYVGITGPNCEFAACPGEISAPEIIYCEPRTAGDKLFGTVCAALYDPVCAQVQVECVTTPCDTVSQTFGNSCSACVNDRVLSYTEGACAEVDTNVETRFGYVRGFDSSSLVIDFAEYFSGDLAIEKAKEEGECLTDSYSAFCVPNGFYISNPDSSEDALPVSDRVIVKVHTDLRACNIPDWGKMVSYEQFKESQINSDCAGNIPYYFQVQNGVIVEIDEQYIP